MAHSPAELAVRSGSLVNIAVVCPYSIEVPGGVQEQAIGLVKELRAAGNQAWLVAPGTTGPEWARLIGPATMVRVNGSVAPVALRPGAVAKARRAVQGAEVVHVHEPLLPPVSPATFLGTDRPAVGTIHADPSSAVRKLYRLGAPALKRVLARLSAVTAVSSVAAVGVATLVGGVITIPNAIDTASFSLKVARRPTRVVFLGRDEPRKGLDVILAAWPTVRAAVEEAELLVMGADRSGSRPGVHFLGRTVGAEKCRQLAGAAVYCAPNLGGESFGITLLEAMAAGCAPVVSDLPSFRLLAGDVAKYAVVGDPESVADQLINAMRDPTETEKRGRAAREIAARYDWQHVLPRYLDLYQQIAR